MRKHIIIQLATRAGLVLTLMLLLAVALAKAQSCQYEKNTIDAVTEVQIKVTQPVALAKLNNNPLYFKAQSIGSRYRFLKMRYYRYNNFSIDEDREISLRLSTNEEIVMHPRINPADTISSVVENVAVQIIYPLTADQYEKLRRYPVTTFKYYVPNGFIEVPIKDSKQGKIIGILNCID